ncbi:TetR/AcrR family transcriptional regulator [Nocardioides marmorisolisilvae]|uniref:TetR/AcrR family transcriptional regulator n=1 Tax=Nocardioides marmorisolisilvae TaxID=1542737 RepID=A0A3N0DS42_9ACTN|nr:TetR/AcrR family transcriptional regulator [Nocardioides marmorisolisilvae]
MSASLGGESSVTSRTYSGLSASERDAERRSRLLAAGRELIGTQGYAAVSVEKLCAASKVSSRHFYQLYENKEAAFLDVYDSITKQSLDSAVASLEATEGEPMMQRIPKAFLAYVGPMVEDIRAARIAFVEIMGASPLIEQRRLSYRELLVDLVVSEGAAAVQRGELVDRDFRFATLALTGAANAIVYDWTLREDREDSAALEAQLTELALDLLAR